MKTGIALVLYPEVTSHMQQKIHRQALREQISWGIIKFVWKRLYHVRSRYRQNPNTLPQSQRVKQRQKFGYCTTIGKMLCIVTAGKDPFTFPARDIAEGWSVVVGSAIGMFAIGTFCILAHKRRSKSTFLWKDYCTDLNSPKLIIYSFMVL